MTEEPSKPSEYRCCEKDHKPVCGHFWYSGYFPVDEERCDSPMKQDYGCTCSGELIKLTEQQMTLTSRCGCLAHSAIAARRKGGNFPQKPVDPHPRTKYIAYEGEYERNILFETVRPQVLYFALCMEKKLRVHDKDRGSRGWVGYTHEDELDFLYKRLRGEVKELQKQLGAVDNYIPNPEFTEADDVGNFAMMIRTSDLSDEQAKQHIAKLIESLRATTPATGNRTEPEKNGVKKDGA